MLNKDSYIKEIESCGILANDRYAQSKISNYMNHLIHDTQYRRNTIIHKVSEVAADYYRYMPVDIISNELLSCYNRLSCLPQKETKAEKSKLPIILYRSEMEIISAIDGEKAQRLALAMLILHKRLGLYKVGDLVKCHQYKAMAKADIFRLAGLDNLSGTNKLNLIQELSDAGFITLTVRTNNSWKHHPDWLSFAGYKVNFNANLKANLNDEQAFIEVKDLSDISLYIRLWRGDKNIILCSDCGTPIERTSNSRKRCRTCAEARRNEKQKCKKMQIENPANAL